MVLPTSPSVCAPLSPDTVRLSSLIAYVSYLLALIGGVCIGLYASGISDSVTAGTVLIVLAMLGGCAADQVAAFGDQTLTVPKLRDMVFLHMCLLSFGIWGVVSWLVPLVIVRAEWIEGMQWLFFIIGLITVPPIVFLAALGARPQPHDYLKD